MSDPQPCDVTWTTSETVIGRDAHREAHMMNVRITHRCMFVVGTYHPEHHECSAGKRCGSYIKAETEDDDE